MNQVSANAVGAGPTTRWDRVGPIVTLLLLAPIVSEVLSGSTRLTTLFVLIPATGVWGCAALLIREASRSFGGRWSLLTLGLALAVAEECVIQQTSLAPLIGVDPTHGYGRRFGVNWIYLLWALGFEAVWAVVVPVTLTETLFPRRRLERWLGVRGWVVTSTVLVLSSLLAWFMWTRVYVPKFFPKSAYHPPALPILIALGVIAALVLVACRRDPRPPTAMPVPSGPAPSPGQLGLFAFLWALPWYLLILLAFNAWRTLPVPYPLAVGVVLAASATYLLGRWSARADWSDARRLALIIGLVAATLVGGMISLTAARALLIDRIAQVVFNLAALFGLLCLLRRARAPAST